MMMMGRLCDRTRMYFTPLEQQFCLKRKYLSRDILVRLDNASTNIAASFFAFEFNVQCVD